MYWMDREHLKSPSKSKRWRRSPPTPGSPAFEELPTVSISFVIMFFLSYLYLFGFALSDSAGASVLEDKALSPAFGSSALRYVPLYYRTTNGIFIHFSNSRPKFKIVYFGVCILISL